jgi:protein SMG6
VLLSIIPGYTMLVVDTNILLSSLSLLAAVIEKVLWTIVIVIMELHGLSSNTSQLGEAGRAAMAYVSDIRSDSASLKVQTWKGNYLSSLAIRTEDIDFDVGKETWMT